MKLITNSAIALCCLAVTPSAQALNLNFITSGLGSDAAAALNRAGIRWSSQLLDPVTINIAVNMTNLNNAQVIGNASAIELSSNYASFRDMMVSMQPTKPMTGSLVIYLRLVWLLLMCLPISV